MIVIGFDLGTKCGWSVMTSDQRLVASGQFSYSGMGHGKRFSCFKEDLDKLILTYSPSVLVYEDVRRHIGTAAAHAYGGYKAVLQMCAWRSGVELHGVGVGTVKKSICGNGRASKQEVIDAVSARFGHEATSSDEADAVAVAVCWLNER